MNEPTIPAHRRRVEPPRSGEAMTLEERAAAETAAEKTEREAEQFQRDAPKRAAEAAAREQAEKERQRAARRAAKGGKPPAVPTGSQTKGE